MTLKVQDDTAALTRFTGAVGLDGVPVAWFWNQVENKRPEVKVGERLTASDIDVEVTEISGRHILMTDAEGTWRLRLGENLRQRELIEPASKPEASAEAPLSESAPVEQPAAEATEQPIEPATAATTELPTETEPAETAPAQTEPAEPKETPAPATPAPSTTPAEPQPAPAAEVPVS